MDAKYIFAIIVLAVFFVLIFISFAFLEYGRIKNEKLQAWLSEIYNNKDVKKYDYDAEDDEDLIPAQKTESVLEETKNPSEDVAEDVPVDDTFGKIDIEGIEEITGNYNGDK